MQTKVKEIVVKDYLSKSKLPVSDYVINPYVGCSHACKYCYACFMKRFTGHEEEWGTFVDVKLCDKPIDTKKLVGKCLFLSSVTDCYNHFEAKYKVTRNILTQLIGVDTHIDISTKSNLILRDLDILKQLKDVQVAFSINTTNEQFRADMDEASTVAERIDALKVLHENGIRTILFMSPMFPEITEWKELVLKTKDFVDEYWFENLNLRGDYKYKILKYVYKLKPELRSIYRKIYEVGDKTYWSELAVKIKEFCESEKVNYKVYFFHEDIRKK